MKQPHTSKIAGKIFGRIFLFTSLLCLLHLPVSAMEFLAPEDVPKSIKVKNKTVTLKGLKNPLRQSPEKLPQFIKEGSNLYFQHCFFCHGDLLDGKGLFSKRFSPAPANFHTRGSIYDRPESYAFWRIMKGGPGLPEKYQPWNSVMPAWEHTLSEEDVWKLILFLFDEIARPLPANPPKEASLERGKSIYQDKCAVCHGAEGKGDGIAASLTSPRPRNLVKGQYKLRTTPFGKIPTDPDLHAMLLRGYPETSMPSWKYLPEVDLQSLVLYLKELGKKKFERALRRKKKVKPIVVPPAPPFDLESQARGRELYLQNCSGCHGIKGRGDGESTARIVDLTSDSIRPRNLSKPWTFRRGFTREDIFLTLRTGLSTTAMPRFSTRIHPDQNIWDLVHYVQTLSPGRKPMVSSKIQVKKVEGPLPESLDDPIWNEVKTFFVPTAPQIIHKVKEYFTTVDNVWIQAVHNGKQVIFRVRWDDPTVDPILVKTAEVIESPAPPLPPHLRVTKDEEADEEPPPPLEPARVPDSIALQFPTLTLPGEALPYFLNGDEKKSVLLWKWDSHPNKTEPYSAHGMGTETKLESFVEVKSKVRFRYGQYQLILPIEIGSSHIGSKEIPIAFNVWDGGEREQGSHKSISNWYQLVLE